MNNDAIIRRLAFIQGFLLTIRPQQDEANQEIMTDLILTIGEDIDQLEALEILKQTERDELPF
jgi:hypothetical protein